MRAIPTVTINSFLTAVRCFDNGYVGKQPVDWKQYCAEYWLKELQESMDRCTGRRDISEIVENSVKHHTINQLNQSSLRASLAMFAPPFSELFVSINNQMTPLLWWASQARTGKKVT